MSRSTHRTWRAGALTLTLVAVFAVATGVVIPLLAYLIYRQQGPAWIPALLIALALVALAYAWRFGLHPRLRVDAEQIQVVNPFRKQEFDWDDVRVIAPGENGLVVGTESGTAEAWCIQKSNFAARRGRRTRADKVAEELLDILDEHDPPLVDEPTGLRIRRARPHEARLLTRLERAASEDALSHIFPVDEHPFPVNDVTHRWRTELVDPRIRIRILELLDTPIGYLAYDANTVHRLGIVRHQTRRGYGSALLDFAADEIFNTGAREADLWVLVDNHSARSFARDRGWTETDDRRRSDRAPNPQSLRLVKANPAAPRRSR